MLFWLDVWAQAPCASASCLHPFKPHCALRLSGAGPQPAPALSAAQGYLDAGGLGTCNTMLLLLQLLQLLPQLLVRKWPPATGPRAQVGKQNMVLPACQLLLQLLCCCQKRAKEQLHVKSPPLAQRTAKMEHTLRR